MTPVECLRMAEQAVAARGVAYGDAYEFFKGVARRWTWRFGVLISPVDAVDGMIEFKLQRGQADPIRPDTSVDIAGYGSLRAYVAQRWNAEQGEARARAGAP